jgi:hypothetical protein
VTNPVKGSGGDNNSTNNNALPIRIDVQQIAQHDHYEDTDDALVKRPFATVLRRATLTANKAANKPC